MADSVWWTKVMHKDFCAHYCEMSDAEIVADVRRSIASLMMQRSDGEDFGASMVRTAMERIEAKHDTAVANGQQGGRPRKSITADGDTREGSHGTRTAAAITRNEPLEHDHLEPSATISQDASTRKGEDDSKAPTSCTHYDQETDRRISTDEALDLLRAGVMAPSSAPTRKGSALTPARNSRRPTSREEFHAFVADNSLHEDLAEEWYAMHDARGWVDENGNPLKNWRGALKNYCIKTEQKRKTA